MGLIENEKAGKAKQSMGIVGVLKEVALPFGEKFVPSLMMMTMMMTLTPPGDEMSEVVSRCLPRRQLLVSNLSKVAIVYAMA